jgi:glycerol-3-phosphate O-acyltransferase
MIRRQTRRVLRGYADGRSSALRAGRSGLSPTEARRRLHRHVAGLVACRRAWAERVLGFLARPVLRGLRRVDADEESLHTLRLLAERGPLVFLPAHRSYIDSLVLASVLRRAGISPPWRLAGDNLAFWPLGPLGRRSGTIFIRRDFGTDPSYHGAVCCYLAHLLSRGQSLEWFPEAGRSRTGRQRQLRSGLIRILVAAYQDAGIADVHVVPVSITYDSVPDTEALTGQDAGSAKQPEGLRVVNGYLRSSRTTGPRSAWLGFGTPISLRELTADAPKPWETVRSLMRRVAAGLREATRVTPESLLALAVPADPRAPRDTAALARRVDALLEHAVIRRIPVCRPVRIDEVLEGLVRAGSLALGPGGVTVQTGRERMLDHHRTVAEHWFMPRAAAELVVAGATTPRRIGVLLAPLDASPATDAFVRKVEAELAGLADGWEEQPFLLAPRLLGHVFEAYHEAALHSSAETGVGSADLRLGSAELRDAANAALAAEGLLDPDGDEGARSAYVDELTALLNTTRAMAAFEAARHAWNADVRR